MLTETVRALARVYPWSVDGSEALDRSLRFLGADLASTEVIRAGYGAAVPVALLVASLLPFVPRSVRPLVAVGAVAGGLGGAHAVHRLPAFLAALRRTRALGAAPDLVCRGVLRMRIEPAEEAAVEFAARTGTGPLAASLRRHVRRAAGTRRSGLDAFAAEWRDWFPALVRSAHLLSAASNASPARREQALDRALSVVLEGTRERMAAFVADVRAPATGVYAFGVLLPLALIAVLPGARVAGVPVSLPLVVAIYDVLLPIGLLGAACWLLVRRPVAFPPPSVDRDHPGVPDRRGPALIAGIAVGIASAIAAGGLTGAWARPLAGFGAGTGVALTVHYRPIVRVREHVREVESGLADALYLVGRRVDEGYAVERAIELAAEELPGATGACLSDAARRQRVLGIGVRASLLGERGALADVPSRRARSVAELLALAAREGRPAGQAIVAMAGHLEDLRSIERRSRHELARVTGTLRNTAAVFGPLVAGATVALADRMAAAGAGTGDVQTLSTAGLGLAVGAYALVLSALLVGLATTLEHGADRPLCGYRVGIALVSATAVFHVAYFGAGTLL